MGGWKVRDVECLNFFLTVFIKIERKDRGGVLNIGLHDRQDRAVDLLRE